MRKVVISRGKTIMANELSQVLSRAKTDMSVSHKLSRGVYVDIVDHALMGDKFSVEMSLHDALKMRARMTYYHKSGVMHQQTQSNGWILVTFNE